MKMEKKFKISILTPTYNRAELLKRLYSSLVKNCKENLEIEWLIMDDGSKDETKIVVENFLKEDFIKIKYQYQENQGKMAAINHLVPQATGDVIIECDSDDYFTENAFEIVESEYKKVKDKEKFYALCFLKYDQNFQNLGKEFPKSETTMFDLYFKEGEDGEKALVFFTPIRKKYHYELEKNERFITEARMFHKMDEDYQIWCVNKPIMICEYQKDGYTKNILKQFRENPNGYYFYFKEILQKNMKGVSFQKRLYTIKHYILFYTLTKRKGILKEIYGLWNKILIVLLYLPGKIVTKIKFSRKKSE